MICTTKELLKQGETEYSIRKMLANGTLFRIDRGLFKKKSDDLVNDEVLLTTKLSETVLTGVSAYSFYGLTDYVPEKIYVASKQHSFPIRKENVVQSYQDHKYFKIGITMAKTDEGLVRIYDFERMLIELIRLKSRYPADLYYEVLSNYRERKEEIDYFKLNKYLKLFGNHDKLLQKIKEVI